MQVEMIRDARPCRLANIHPHIAPVRTINFCDGRIELLSHLHHLSQRFRLELQQLSDVSVRHHERVGRSIRVEVEDDEIEASAMQDQVFAVTLRLSAGQLTEHALAPLTRSNDIAESPGTPQIIHRVGAGPFGEFLRAIRLSGRRPEQGRWERLQALP